ncbi:MAG: DUF411 domain-containing protein [Thermoanaerobaculia bacterium]|nr:DUF411 domain-containing protein [Thermoanaerobaculia bacterium]
MTTRTPSQVLTPLALALALLACSAAAELPSVKVYKTATCGCCSKWADQLADAGFEVKTEDVENIWAVKDAHGVPRSLGSCHTALVEGYFVEGHVPIADVERLLEERPDIAGIAVPGMPIGSPGMEGPNPERYDVIAVGHDGSTEVYATHGP